MRTNEPDPPPWRPLGDRVVKTPVSPAPEFKPRPGSPGIEENARGQLRTNLPSPKA